MAQKPPVTAALLDQFGPTVVLTEAEAKDHHQEEL